MYKNGYYIHLSLLEGGSIRYPGVAKKIQQQINVMNKEFSVIEIQLESKDGSKIRKRLPGGSNFYNWNEIVNEIKDPSYIYIRNMLVDYGYIYFFKEIKRRFKDVKILLELPTYPYEKEKFPMSSFREMFDYPLLLKDRHNRNKFHKYVDRIVTYTEDQEIFGIPTIQIQNGVDVEAFPLVENNDHKQICLIAVAALQPYHGYERIIEGIALYNARNNRKVKFYIVGSGEEGSKLEKIVRDKKLEEFIVFFGTKTGNELTELFNQADIGIGSFGFYKIGLDRASSLKTREYLARGLPVVSGCRQDIFEIAPCDYHIEYPNDNSPVDIQKIVEFYDKLFGGRNKEDVINKIRTYAEENVTMEKAFAPVIEYLKNNISKDSDE